jgi:CYTH domain-containing protein
MYEIECKYLISRDKFLSKVISSSSSAQKICQYYLVDTKDMELRLRIIQNKVFITFKKGEGLKRIEEEYEFDLSKSNFLEYLILNHLKSFPFISKIRYSIPYKNYKIEVDIFDSTDLSLAEVEFNTEEEYLEFKKDIPSWFLAEVTYNEEFKNKNIAK